MCCEAVDFGSRRSSLTFARYELVGYDENRPFRWVHFMAVSVDQFGKTLVASGLLSADEVKVIWSATAAETRPKSGDGFAKLLVKQQKLTPFQAEELLAGSGTPLVLGDYVLLSKIGAGGMGQVFKAHHRRMDRPAAIKLLPSSLTKDEA